MRHLFTDLLHGFVIFMMVIFVIGGVLAITGAFDHWTERLSLKRRRRRLLRQRTQLVSANSEHNTPYNSIKPDKTTISYKGRYA